MDDHEVTKFAEIFLDTLRLLKLENHNEFKVFFEQIRDTLVKRIHNSEIHKDSRETLRIAEKFKAKQMFVKIVKDVNTPEFIDKLN